MAGKGFTIPLPIIWLTRRADAVSAGGPREALFLLSPSAAMLPWSQHPSVSQRHLEPQPLRNMTSSPACLGPSFCVSSEDFPPW